MNMKRMVLALSLSLAAFGFLVSPPLAAASPAPAAPVLSLSDQAFLASLAGTPAPELADKRPAVRLKSFCTVSCWSGGTITCTGNTCVGIDSSCPSEPGHVTCDGVTATCSPCPCEASPDWCTHEDDCAIQCAPCDYTYTCNETFCTDHCKCNFRTCLQ
jgi:hypothetical protein